MNLKPVTGPTVETLRQARSRQEAVTNWLRPLAPLVLLVVIWAAFQANPRPGPAGWGLVVSIALGAVVLSGSVALAVLPRQGRLRVVGAVGLIVSAAALVWLQPDGAGIAGIFVGVSLLAFELRAHVSVPITIVALVFLAVAVATSEHGSITTALLDAVMLGAFYGMAFLAMRLGDANELAERLLLELEQSRAVAARAAALAERQRLAREMHDVLAHSLSGLLLQLEGARMLAVEDPGDARLPRAIDRAHHLGRAGLEEARRAIGTLRDEELLGPERLPGLAAQFQQDRTIPCCFSVSGATRELDSEARLALYRVAQEALTNITKHAQPERVELHLAYEPGATRLTVEDFTATAAPAPDLEDGYGLTGMRERAELLGGTLTTEATGRGFRVELAVPA